MEEWHKAEEELRNTLEDEWAEGQSKLPTKKEDTTTKTKKPSLERSSICSAGTGKLSLKEPF